MYFEFIPSSSVAGDGDNQLNADILLDSRVVNVFSRDPISRVALSKLLSQSNESVFEDVEGWRRSYDDRGRACYLKGVGGYGPMCE